MTESLNSSYSSTTETSHSTSDTDQEQPFIKIITLNDPQYGPVQHPQSVCCNPTNLQTFPICDCDENRPQDHAKTCKCAVCKVTSQDDQCSCPGPSGMNILDSTQKSIQITICPDCGGYSFSGKTCRKMTESPEDQNDPEVLAGEVVEEPEENLENSKSSSQRSSIEPKNEDDSRQYGSGPSDPTEITIIASEFRDSQRSNSSVSSHGSQSHIGPLESRSGSHSGSHTGSQTGSQFRSFHSNSALPNFTSELKTPSESLRFMTLGNSLMEIAKRCFYEWDPRWTCPEDETPPPLLQGLFNSFCVQMAEDCRDYLISLLGDPDHLEQMDRLPRLRSDLMLPSKNLIEGIVDFVRAEFWDQNIADFMEPTLTDAVIVAVDQHKDKLEDLERLESDKQASEAGSEKRTRSTASSKKNKRKQTRHVKKTDKKPQRKMYICIKRRKRIGIQVGHKECVQKDVIVPGHMGWLWNYWSPYSIPKPKTLPRPGCVPRHIAELIYQTRRQIRKQKRDVKNSKQPGKSRRKPLAALTVEKKDGFYFITMKPLKDPLKMTPYEASPYVNCAPIEMKIPTRPGKKMDGSNLDRYGLKSVKNRTKVESDCSSSYSDFNIEFTPPLGLLDLKTERKPDVVHVETQFNAEEEEERKRLERESKKRKVLGRSRLYESRKIDESVRDGKMVARGLKDTVKDKGKLGKSNEKIDGKKSAESVKKVGKGAVKSPVKGPEKSTVPAKPKELKVEKLFERRRNK